MAYEAAGFNGEVTLQLIGRGWKATEKQCLTGKYFKRGECAKFNLEMLDVGIPEFVRFDLHGSREKQWACDEVIVTYRDVETRFPIYDWIESEITAASGEAFTYTQASQELREVREEEIERAKGRFAWIPKPTKQDIGWGIPRYVDSTSYSGLPKIFKEKEERSIGFIENMIGTMLATVAGRADAKLTALFNFALNDFKKLYKYVKSSGGGIKVEDPPFAEKWYHDEEFGRQQIMGVTPLALKRCTSLPEGCNITDGDLHLEGKTLEDEMKEKRIFIGDYSTIFDGIERNKNDAGIELHCPHAIGLFRANEDGDLVPIAIQLIPGDRDSIFTPHDNKNSKNETCAGQDNDWLLAKMYYRVAASNMHEWYYHFLLTHNVMEPFAVGLFRNIPRSHPLYKLLRPHLQTVSAINTEAREALIGPGTIANKSLAILGIALARQGYKNFDMKDLVVPKVISERGLDDRDVLPRNFFRDDALKLWSIIENYVKSMLQLYYTSNQDVVDDKDIQSFAHDVATNGLGWQDGDTKGMEKAITSFPQLVELCTILIYTSSAGHAAVNFPQFQNYQFIPNSPGGMRLAPHRKGDMIYLGDFPMMLFTEDRAQEVIKTFDKDLISYGDIIRKRNEQAGPEGYKWLLPSYIPNSIAV